MKTKFNISYILVFIALFISSCTVSQKPLYNTSALKQEITDYKKLDDIRYLRSKPANYSKAFVIENKTLYYFDPVSTDKDDSLLTLRQRMLTSGRWKAIGISDSQGSSATLPYQVYTALLTQSGTDTPVATVLQNTIDDNITITREVGGGGSTKFINFNFTNDINVNKTTFTCNIIYSDAIPRTIALQAYGSKKIITMPIRLDTGAIVEIGTIVEYNYRSFLVEIRVYP